MSSIPFSVPFEFVSGVNDGSLTRIGALLKDSGTGRIVGHMQETGVAQQFLNGISQAPFSPLDTLELLSSGYTGIQLNQLKSLVEGLQLMQIADLGASVAGLGISAVGFSMLYSKLKALENKFDGLAEKIEEHFRVLNERVLRQHYSHVSALFEKAQLAQNLSNSAMEWRQVAFYLADESGFFKGEIKHLLTQECFDRTLFTSLVQSLALCNAGRIESLLLANELAAARDTADMIGRNYRELFDHVRPFELRNKIPVKKSPIAIRRNQLEMNRLVLGLREITDAALTQPFLIDSLIAQDINGNDYVKAIRSEKEHPLLVLKHG